MPAQPHCLLAEEKVPSRNSADRRKGNHGEDEFSTAAV